MTYTHTQTGQQVLLCPYSFALPSRPVCVCAGSGDRKDKLSWRCHAPILGVVTSRSEGDVPPQCLWPNEQKTEEVGPDGSRGGAWAWGAGMVRVKPQIK